MLMALGGTQATVAFRLMEVEWVKTERNVNARLDGEWTTRNE